MIVRWNGLLGLVILASSCAKTEVDSRLNMTTETVENFDNVQAGYDFNYDMYKRVHVHLEDVPSFSQFNLVSVHYQKNGPMRWVLGSNQPLSEAGPLVIPDVLSDVWLKAHWKTGEVSWMNLNVWDTSMVIAFNTIVREEDNWSTNKMNCPDSDNDGIDDCNDDFPNDSLLAYLVETDIATFAAEDTWPWKGDYDFNDMVMTYGHRSYVSPAVEIRSMKIYYKFLARGAAQDNGIGFIMNTSPSGANVNGYNITQSYVSHVNGVETGSTSELSMVVEDLVSNKLSSWNTYANVPLVADTYDTVTVTFSTPRNLAVHATVDPYLIINQNRGKELRYPNIAPSFNMNTTLLGSGYDVSNALVGTYFKQANGQPWALKIPGEFSFLKEGKSITSGYLNFASWALSGGTNNADWYDHTIPANVDTTKLRVP